MPEQTKWGRWIRLLLLLLVGIKLTQFAYNSKYHTSAFDDLEVGFWLLLGLPVWVWSLIRAVQRLYLKRKFGGFALPVLGLAFLPVIRAVKHNAQADLKKPTLLRVYYDGDYNGTGFDFKTDGTYIFDDFCLGSSFTYGTYQIVGDKITLDRDTINRFGGVKYLEVRWAEPRDQSLDWYLLPVDSAGRDLPTNWTHRVVVDNRKK